METIPAFSFDRSEMIGLAERLAPTFRSAEPFPHIAIPNFLPEDVAHAVAAEFPGVSDIDWRMVGPGPSLQTDDPTIEKMTSVRAADFPPLIRHVMHEFNSSEFLDFVSTISGYKRLFTDPRFEGGGLHSTGNGGRMMIHADGSRNDNPKLVKALNLVYYATPGWREAWGGHFELWDADAQRMVKKIAPTFNTALLFFTGPTAFHGHPWPTKSPRDVRRNSLSVFYYGYGPEVTSRSPS
jgi:hypothetical protein